jgi:hypothetical protein
VDANAKDTTNEANTPSATFFYHWYSGLDFDGVKLETPADLAPILADIISDAVKTLAVCATPGVELDNVDWDKRAGFIFCFSTTDPEIAQRLGFDEMFRDDAEDFETAPWAVQS